MSIYKYIFIYMSVLPQIYTIYYIHDKVVMV